MLLKIDETWRRFATILAENHSDAFRQAMSALTAGHYDKQLRLEQVEDERDGRELQE
jgi:hypothetical protein